MTKDIAQRLIPHHKKGMKRAARQLHECTLNGSFGFTLKKTKGHNWKARRDRKYILWAIERTLLIECYELIKSHY